ncbi:MAG: SPFH domain-containing protein [Candidatus Bathyarchaeota archaeon]|nr:SPFH domain-containing protein [Candidatus Bathyarchaeota archaeon]
MPKVIEWIGAREGEIVWRYPREEIAWGDTLIVHEYEASVFLRDGKAYDVFRAGRHVLTSANLPLITKVLSAVVGFDKVPFRATVIFISLKQFQGRFGAQGQTKELAPIKFYGSFWFRVEDPNLFVNEVVGGQGTYTTTGLQEFIRGYFNERIIDALSQYSLVEVYGKLDETSFLAKNVLYDAFKRIGLELIDVKFEGIDTTPEWRDRIFYIRTGVSAEEVLRMQTVQKTAESLSKSPGAAVGAGVAIIPPLFQPYTPTQAPPMILCSRCGFQNPQTAKFCSNCGTQLRATGPACPNCGTINQAGAKFCANCGQKLA